MAEPSAYYSNQNTNRTWTWLVPVLIIGAVLLAWAYYYNKPQTNTNSTQTTPAESSQPVNNGSNLGTATAGTRAQLSNISINQVVSNRIFSIKSGNQTIYAILSPNVTLPNKTTLQAGQQVAITGTLVSTNSEQFTNLNLTQTEKTALTNQNLVLLVDQVTISGSNATSNPNTPTK
jgi:hypothetical protein